MEVVDVVVVDHGLVAAALAVLVLADQVLGGRMIRSWCHFLFGYGCGVAGGGRLLGVRDGVGDHVRHELAWLVVTGSGFVGALAGLPADEVASVRAAYLASLAEEQVLELDATTLTGIGVSPRTADGLG
ncbi:hypothetical protein [Aeromicrobium phragmitis]|uniref:hypothetical protein n=1 Tax=Aeromicrobium phragmitis TaxID=2478914 RepID=UPI001AA09287|nr:hypothetical protein [Aeromicrobium phragmitis]